MDVLANRKFVAAAVALLLLAFVGQSLYFAAISTYTYDETVSVINGYYYITTHDLRLGLSQPPLSAYLSAIPLFFMHANFDFSRESCRTYDNWLCAQQVLFESGNNAAQILFFSRLVSILAMAGTGIVIFLFASRLFGSKAGLLSLALFAVNPVLISQGSLALTNPFLTFFVALNLYMFFLLLKSFSWRLFTAFAATFALAMVSKVNAFLLLLVYALALLVLCLWKPAGFSILGMSPQHINWKAQIGLRPIAHSAFRGIALLGRLAVFAAVAFIVVLAVYQFQFGTLAGSVPPKNVHDFESKVLPKLPASVGAAAKAVVFRLPIPFPSFFSGAAWHSVAGQGKVSFLNGAAFTGHKLFFIPIVLLAKTPVAFLLLAVFGLAACFKRKLTNDVIALLLLLSAAVAWVVFFSASVNSGVAHLLPVYVFLAILAGAAATVKSRVVPAFIAVMLLWNVIAALSIAPHYLAYFNELVGGPDRGHRIVGVPNFDWGQDLPALKQYMAGSSIPSVKLSYFGTADPSYYGINHEYLASPRFQPWDPEYVPVVPKDYTEQCGKATGIIAVSATNYYGVFLNNRGCYAWLQSYAPIARPGHTIFVYNISG